MDTPPRQAGFAKPRIAVAMEYPLLQQGGTETLVRELVRGLAGRFDIVLVTGDATREGLGEEFDGLISAHYYWDKLKPTPQTARKLALALDRERIEFAHFHAGGSYEWQSYKAQRSPLFHLARAGVPCIVTSHLVGPLLVGFSRPERPVWQKLLLWPWAWLNKARILRLVQAEYLISRHDLTKMKAMFPFFSGKFRQMYHSQLQRSEQGLPATKRNKTILCLGTFCERKGQLVLVRAFGRIAKKHPDWTLELRGRCETPEYLQQIHQVVDELAISAQVKIASALSHPASALECAAIFAMPSLYEGLGLSLQEALYYECACVGSNVGGIPELIEDGVTGLLVPPSDSEALASALERLISDPELRQQLAQQARSSMVEKGMLADLMVGNHVRLYESLLERSGT